ncbi:aminodeoxychorismate lyase [Paraneptunicella aestuarii]|uniref:aminodeoxychorismate lyase n=1 Tax=Paraneptunicella aestuarii TaxID=2831148 RepID=UPI001E3FE559|nr:aminodeoxychorismate lyase [Paraneptunicella aestuarii]UAA40412.1 aminodeoxychorismate lyase [Paraneptunicella aestuarii]
MNITYQSNTYPSQSRAVAYGDGCFTTMLVRQGAIQLFELHMQRLQQDTQKLGLKEFQPEEFRQFIDTLQTNELAQQNLVLKVLVSAGMGGRGYQRDHNAELQVNVTSHPVPEYYEQWQEQGIALGLSPFKLAMQPELSGIKHLNRLEQVLVKSAFAYASNETQDEIVTDTQGMVVETSVANLFWRENQQWFTPDLHYCGVAGVMREHIIQRLAEHGFLVHQVRVKPQLLSRVDSLLMCNSLMQLVPVTSLIFDENSYEIACSQKDVADIHRIVFGE